MSFTVNLVYLIQTPFWIAINLRCGRKERKTGMQEIYALALLSPSPRRRRRRKRKQI
jgi:hypothetical protein